jgi:hypothetical protein
MKFLFFLLVLFYIIFGLFLYLSSKKNDDYKIKPGEYEEFIEWLKKQKKDV